MRYCNKAPASSPSPSAPASSSMRLVLRFLVTIATFSGLRQRCWLRCGNVPRYWCWNGAILTSRLPEKIHAVLNAWTSKFHHCRDDDLHDMLDNGYHKCELFPKKRHELVLGVFNKINT